MVHILVEIMKVETLKLKFDTKEQLLVVLTGMFLLVLQLTILKLLTSSVM